MRMVMSNCGAMELLPVYGKALFQRTNRFSNQQVLKLRATERAEVLFFDLG